MLGPQSKASWFAISTSRGLYFHLSPLPSSLNLSPRLRFSFYREKMFCGKGIFQYPFSMRTECLLMGITFHNYNSKRRLQSEISDKIRCILPANDEECRMSHSFRFLFSYMQREEGTPQTKGVILIYIEQ